MKNIQRIASFDNVSVLHHHNVVAECFHHLQIMADEEIAQLQLLSQVFQQLDNLRLNGLEWSEKNGEPSDTINSGGLHGSKTLHGRF
ncbi:hypothetical protein PsAD37_02749 [Pseudovibrio sp. Ad37]|nr:hypothetical protein PsAD37_02749 [Pseudovibrio sp. Ad37]KZL26675.1 hypothetical protein PsWM33_01288 [Pseudovibrio sp. WM33]